MSESVGFDSHAYEINASMVIKIIKMNTLKETNLFIPFNNLYYVTKKILKEVERMQGWKIVFSVIKYLQLYSTIHISFKFVKKKAFFLTSGDRENGKNMSFFFYDYWTYYRKIILSAAIQ